MSPASSTATSRAAEQRRAGTVLAGGALCWRWSTRRSGRRELEVLLVHSVKYDEWSWPKGKLDAGETLPECAVREVAEETGLQILLGRPLPPSRYVLPDGRHKEVSYWAAQLPAEVEATPASPHEVDDVDWVPLDRTERRLSRPGDLAPLRALRRQAEDGEPDTSALLVLRHAEAQPRKAWTGHEQDRPLSSAGMQQAEALVGLLGCWHPELLLSSTWQRCTATLAPYAAATGAEVATKAGLTEAGYRRHPGKVGRHLDRLGAAGSTGLVCTHRPVLGGVMVALRERAVPELDATMPGRDPWLEVAEVLVAHLRDGRDGSVRYPLVALERHRPA